MLNSSIGVSPFKTSETMLGSSKHINQVFLL